MKYTGGNFMKETLIRRQSEAHKGDFGRDLIFAGSPGMAGAAVLCGRSALKGGAGLVRFLLPSFDDLIYPVLQGAVPEATCVQFSEGMRFDEYKVIAAGSGLGSDPVRIRMLSKIIETYEGVLVLDADALNYIAANEDAAQRVAGSKAQVIITPHAGEAARLLGVKPGQLYSAAHPRAREDVAEDLVRKYNCIVVFKGNHTIVARDCDGYVDMYENTSGNPGMATAGSGDVLSGVIAALAGLGYDPFSAARMGVYIQGLAGDMAAEEKGEMGLTAMDISDNVPYALKAYYK